MAERFIRVDVSEIARDFRPLAIEPGVPLLDRAGTNDRILFRWLGGMVAEAEWEGESVNFYVRDDHGGRLEEVRPQAASEDDLKGPLKDDIEVLRQRISKAKPETSTEKALHRILVEQFKTVVENENRTDRPNYFFKYRDATGRWRLVWAWGYQRLDQEPAPTYVCSDRNCNLLFVRRKGQSAKCPACEAALIIEPKKKKRRRPVITTLLLLLLVALLAYWLWTRNQLVATPDDWTGPVGSRVAYTVKTPGLFGFFSQDVTQDAVAVVDDPRIVRFDPLAGTAVARNAGTTVVHFYSGTKRGKATLAVSQAENPERIFVQPEAVELAVGTTAHLKLMGEMKDKTVVDLTESAEWYPQNDSVAYAFDGYVEGLAPGSSKVNVRYRAGPDAPYMDTAADVTVGNVSFTGLEVAVSPDPVPVGGGAKLRVDAVTADGLRYSVLDSSQLRLDLEPRHVAKARGPYLLGKHPGRGHLTASLGQLSADTDFDVRRTGGVESLVVAPEQMTLALGEVAELSVAAPGGSAVRMTSSAPAVVQVASGNKLVGRSEGQATVEVSQGGETRQVEVSVARADVRAITVEPGLVGVPVDHTVTVRVDGHLEDGRRIELASGLVTPGKTPSPEVAEFQRHALALHGNGPSSPSSPQKLSLGYKRLTVDAPVEVVQAPLRLELTPPGAVELPLGQALQPEVWANYPAGYTVQLFGERIAWHGEKGKEAKPGLELRGSKVVALAAGGGPLNVWGTYLGVDSNRVVFRSVEAGDVTLQLYVDRKLRLSGEPGWAVLTGTGPQGDVELVPELAEFSTSDENVIDVNPKSGAFRAGQIGEAKLTAKHAASKEPAGVDLVVVDPANSKLAFEPEAVILGVDEKASLRLFLQSERDGKPVRARMVGPGVGYSIGQPAAVRWHPPTLTGLEPAGPFDITASFFPYLTRPATARVEVVSTDPPAALRVTPGETQLARGQSVSLEVEEQLPGGEAWREVRPDAVQWDVPSGVIWQAPTEGLRPAVTLPPGTSGSMTLTASYRGQQATAQITSTEPALDPTDASVNLVLEREPEGRYLPVGRQQRYSIGLRKGDQREPAADVRWPRDFENEFVRWEAPVLTAKRPGYQQWLTAYVGGRAVRFYTNTVDLRPGQQPTLPEDAPARVVITSDQGPSVQFPVGAEFDDFRVEAIYPEPDGTEWREIVTKKATMRVSDGSPGAVGFSGGRILGVSPGSATVQAEFMGVSSTEGLACNVTADVDVDRIAVTAKGGQSEWEMLVGENQGLEATGFKDGKSVGKITGLGGLVWRSDNPSSVAVAGPQAAAQSLGDASVTAELAGIQSRPATVHVVDQIASRLLLPESDVTMRVGQSLRLGPEFGVLRGKVDVSDQVQAWSQAPKIVSYDPETRSLRANAPGAATVTFGLGDKHATARVHVLPGGPLSGRVVIEPGAASIPGPGLAMPLEVYLIAEDGSRMNRTESAVLSSSDPNVVMRGNLACAASPGSATITAQLPESEEPGTAAVTVGNEEITGLVVEPPHLDLSVGDAAPIRVLGQTAAGTLPMYPQEALQLTPAGPKPDSILVSGNQVEGVSPGEAAVAVNYRSLPAQQVTVSVGDNPYEGLVIDPPYVTSRPGEKVVFMVGTTRGGAYRNVTAADGLELLTDNPDVAQIVAEDTAAVAGTPGEATIVARLDGQEATARMVVVPGNGEPIGPDVLAGEPGNGVGFVEGGYVGPDGTFYEDGDYVVDEGGIVYDRDGHVIYDPGVAVVDHGGYYGPGYGIYDPGYVEGIGETYLPPPAAAAGLRFQPETVHVPTNSAGTPVRVYEVLPSGLLGRDVTNDPALKFNEVEPDIARIEKTDDGVMVVPGRAGETRIAANLDGTDLFSDPPLLVQVGDYGITVGAGRLAVNPEPLDLWSGETRGFDSVMVYPGGGLSGTSVPFSVTPLTGQDSVSVEADGRLLHALVPGTAQVRITAQGEGQWYDGLSTMATVRVTAPGRLWIEPSELTMKKGEVTPQFSMLTQTDDGLTQRVPAAFDSLDSDVLAPAAFGGRSFLARGMGKTQIRAVWRGREAFADVDVTGQRFIDVRTTLNEGDEDFYVTVRVLAAASEGPLEYRAYAAGQTPPEAWVPADEAADGSRVVLQSPRMVKGPWNQRYGLVLEARSRQDGTVERYPLTFRLAPTIVTERPLD